MIGANRYKIFQPNPYIKDTSLSLHITKGFILFEEVIQHEIGKFGIDALVAIVKALKIKAEVIICKRDAAKAISCKIPKDEISKLANRLNELYPNLKILKYLKSAEELNPICAKTKI